MTDVQTTKSVGVSGPDTAGLDAVVTSEAIHEFVKNAKPKLSRALIDFFVWGWAMLILGIAIFCISQSPWTFCVAFLVVTSRMGAVLALSHDAQHLAFLPNKRWNDLLAAWFCAYPFGSIYGSSRAVHLTHHKLLNTPEDPDRNFHIENDKHTPRQFIWHFARLVFGGQLWTSIIVNGLLRPMNRNPAGAGPTVVLRRTGHPEILNLIPVQAVIFASLWLASGYWWLYFALWLGPIFTLGTFLGFLRGFVDHARLDCEVDGSCSGRLISVRHVNLVERWFLAGLDFKYHAEHHLFPSVPHYYLPELHELMQRNEHYRKQYCVRESYSKFLADYWRQISARPSES